jgi:hypothetical protein
MIDPTLMNSSGYPLEISMNSVTLPVDDSVAHVLDGRVMEQNHQGHDSSRQHTQCGQHHEVGDYSPRFLGKTEVPKDACE